MMAQLEARVTLARQLVSKAGRLAKAAFGRPGLQVENKGPGDVVSAADFAIERMVRETLAISFPADHVIGEEYGGTAAERGYTWLVDPIDGTVNFARGLAYFCISLALVADLRPVAAWILDPVLDELFWAGPAGVAYLGERPIVCRKQEDFNEAVIGLGFSPRHDRALTGLIVGRLFEAGAENRRLGAGALSLAHVAAGRLDAYCEPHMNPWDAVGGLYIARCASAITGDYPSGGGLARGGPVFAASPAIADRLLALLPPPFPRTLIGQQHSPLGAPSVTG